MENLLTFDGLSLEYQKYGCGKKIMIAFHGFGRSYHDFKIFERLWGDEYTLYAFNNFHHGNSFYPKERIEQNTLTKEELFALFRHFLNEIGAERFSILGYSMGGKIGLTLIEGLADRIDKVFLFAPDGFSVAWWYKFASRTKLGNWLYRFTLNNPGWFFGLTNIAFKLKFIGQKLHKFVFMHIDSREKRQLVYDVWMTYRYILPDLKLVKQQVSDHDIKMWLFFGKYDKIIKPEFGQRFISKAANPDIKLEVMPIGHNMLTNKTIDFLMTKKEYDAL